MNPPLSISYFMCATLQQKLISCQPENPREISKKRSLLGVYLLSSFHNFLQLSVVALTKKKLVPIVTWGIGRSPIHCHDLGKGRKLVSLLVLAQGGGQVDQCCIMSCMATWKVSRVVNSKKLPQENSTLCLRWLTKVSNQEATETQSAIIVDLFETRWAQTPHIGL